LNQDETREIVAELKAIIIEALQLLDVEEEPLRNAVTRTRANEQSRA
jgi:hypothetical protein